MSETAATSLTKWKTETNLESGTLNLEPSVLRIDEQPARRWYPVIDYTRCTNCMECLDFCLFGVYGVDKLDTILIEQPDNCRKGCPACSRVCPENAIIFPQHKTPAIAGSDERAGVLKIDLSKLFGGGEGATLLRSQSLNEMSNFCWRAVTRSVRRSGCRRAKLAKSPDLGTSLTTSWISSTQSIFNSHRLCGRRQVYLGSKPGF